MVDANPFTDSTPEPSNDLNQPSAPLLCPVSSGPVPQKTGRVLGPGRQEIGWGVLMGACVRENCSWWLRDSERCSIPVIAESLMRTEGNLEPLKNFFGAKA